jgi:16S rRNA C967 or C1407 C5-methylase (RsmB/RsmF family)
MGSTVPSSQRFDKFYSSLYLDRWETLKRSLVVPSTPIAYSEGLEKTYFLDEASIIAANLLPVSEGDHVLDMCAAPGGKSLVLANKLRASGSLTCNDRSSQRRLRLRKVLDEHLPESWRASVSITSHDASKWGLYEQSAYDAILLDAPCSSERHVLQDPKALELWGPARTKHLAVQQFAMLAAALEAVKPGGYILYSTCSISSLENESVVERLAKKRSGRYEEIPIEAPFSEKLSHGHIILPDTAQGKGPLYFCLIRRLS